MLNLEQIGTLINGLKFWVNDKIDKKLANISIAADWEQNDPSQNDYIKNRPFYEEINTTDISGTSYTISGLSVSEPTKVLDNTIPLELGQVWECTREHRDAGWTSWKTFEVQQADDGTLFLGTQVNEDGTIVEDNMVNIYLTQNEFAADPSIIRSGYHSFKFTCIYGVVTDKTIKQIEEKYLPDSVFVQPDWNQNDESENDYIKNRPFYEAIEDVVVVPEQTITFENGPANFEYNEVENMWNTGVDYTVIFDGISYNGTTYEDGDTCIRTDFVTNDGYNVYVYDYNHLIASGMTGEHTIQIILNMPVVHKIDEKFLPDTVATNDELARQTGIKMDKTNPNGTGSFSMNRLADSIVGDYSSAVGFEVSAEGLYASAHGCNTVANSQSLSVDGEYNIKTVYVEPHNWKNIWTANVPEDVTIYASEGYVFDQNSGLFSLTGNIKTLTLSSITSGYYFLLNELTSEKLYRNYQSKKLDRNGKTYSILCGKQDSYSNSRIKGPYVHIVGNGTSEKTRSNAHTLDWDGNAWFAGDIYVGSTSGTNKDEGSKKLVTEDDIKGLTASDIGAMPANPYDSGFFSKGGFGYTESIEDIVWDGDTTGKQTLGNEKFVIKISDVPVDLTKVEKLTISQEPHISTSVTIFDKNMLTINDLGFASVIVRGSTNLVYSVPEDTYQEEIGTIQKGTYFKISGLGYVSRVEFTETINKIDPKYLPDTVASIVDINEAKAYADSIKDDLLNGAGEAYDTLKELGDLIDENHNALEALDTIANKKQDKITGTAGQFVVIGADGNLTTKTIPSAEEVTF